MNKIPIMQYFPLTRSKATERYTKTLNKSNVMVILDLEDSAQNPFNIIETDQLKIQASNGLESISKNSNFTPSCNTYIRINAINKEYFEDDIQSVITACNNNIGLTSIFVPKVESYLSLKKINNKLSK
jgi:citrate lyase beta subunit